MKKDLIIKVVLVALIALSLFLTFMIWTMPSQFNEETNASQGTTSSVSIARDMSQVFGPTQIVLHKNGEINAFTQTEIVTAITREFTKWKVDTIEEPIELTNEEYQEKLRQTNAL